MVEPWSFSRVQKYFHNPFFFILREQKRYNVHLKNRLRALYAQSFRITLAPPYYRGCWHGVGRDYSFHQCCQVVAIVRVCVCATVVSRGLVVYLSSSCCLTLEPSGA